MYNRPIDKDNGRGGGLRLKVGGGCEAGDSRGRKMGTTVVEQQ